MRQRDETSYLEILPPSLNALRLYRRLRMRGRAVRVRGRYARFVRHRQALKNPHIRRALVGQVAA